jgi:hypothetical protein
VFYDERLLSLPVPTPEQTARFAEHVAGNHSWYKRLPFFPPGVSCVLFPNPHAGRGVKAEGVRFVVYDIERGDYFAHHSRLSTAEYLAQFGHWDYWVEDSLRAFDPQAGPWLYSTNGSRELLADDLKRLGSCWVTAFLKPSPWMFKLQEVNRVQQAEAFVAYARAHPGAPGVTRYHPLVGEVRGADETWPSPALNAFMWSETLEQRKLLLSTLNRVRVAWVEWQGGPAEPL